MTVTNILLIETATQACSVALSRDGRVVAERYVNEFKVHASRLAPFVDEVLKEAGLQLKDCSAVAVSEGPGSYTGLRVGVSTAKGLCFGADLPLLAVPTLDILAQEARARLPQENSIIIPMLDARRMEVYCAVYDSRCVRQSEVEAKVLEADSFAGLFGKYDRLVFIGDGALKFKPLLSDSALEKSLFIESYPSARYMVKMAEDAYKKKEFKDCAYFEPFYLKEFVAGISKKSILKP